MYRAVYQLRELGTFDTMPEAFKAIYDVVKAEKVLTWQMLETTVWIEGTDGKEYFFHEARDMMCKEGYLVNGKWVGKVTPLELQHGRGVKPLAQYLGKEIAYNIYGHDGNRWGTTKWRELLE